MHTIEHDEPDQPGSGLYFEASVLKNLDKNSKVGIHIDHVAVRNISRLARASPCTYNQPPVSVCAQSLTGAAAEDMHSRYFYRQPQ